MSDSTPKSVPRRFVEHEEHEKVNGFIRRFAMRVGADLDLLDSTGFSEFCCGQLTVGITANPEHDLLLLLAPMEGIPINGGIHFYRRLLALNFLETGPCAFAIDEEKQRLCLRILRPLTGLSYEEFEQLLQAIATVGQSMQQRINRLAEGRSGE